MRFQDFRSALRDLFTAGRATIALCSSGIVIRILAPLLDDKWAEPAVVAVAEDGSAVVPLLGGHRGANRLAVRIAEVLGCPAAITTAGDARFQLALDEPPPGWHVQNPETAKTIMSALLRGEDVALKVEAASPSGLTAGGATLPTRASSRSALPIAPSGGRTPVWSFTPRCSLSASVANAAPRRRSCRSWSSRRLPSMASPAASIACVVSLDIKAAEPAIHSLAAHLGVPARFFPAAQLEAESTRLANPSSEVFAVTGCHGVAEGAALAAAGADGELVVAKAKSARATCALARAPMPLDPDRIGRAQGRLALVGLGPGDAGWRTPEARTLLDDAEDWVGYDGYLQLLEATIRRNATLSRSARRKRGRAAPSIWPVPGGASP